MQLIVIVKIIFIETASNKSMILSHPPRVCADANRFFPLASLRIRLGHQGNDSKHSISNFNQLTFRTMHLQLPFPLVILSLLSTVQENRPSPPIPAILSQNSKLAFSSKLKSL